jgi:predicted amino acid racemase
VFLEATMRRNPQLVDAAVELHRGGLISPGTFVIDIDRVAVNAGIIAARAESLSLRLHMMTKQHGRNPFLALAARHAGIRTAVAVDMSEARVLHRHGLALGHVGHLVQIPARETSEALAMRPQAVTVFTVEAARRLSQAAAGTAGTGRVQDILLRVWKPGDFIHPGQEGGFRLDQVEAAAKTISDLPGIRIAGVTSFPCLVWDEASQQVRPTGNLASVTEAAGLLRGSFGIELTQVNAPGVSSASTLELIAAVGATHGEPGSALTGSTPPNAVRDEPETPAFVYVSEVSALDGDSAYCFGGGFYARSRLARALVADEQGNRQVSRARQLPPEVIDYYGSVAADTGRRPSVGDTVVFSFRSQAFVGRCHVAAVSGLAGGRPRVMGICDQGGNLLGPDSLPLSGADAAAEVAREWRRYLGSAQEAS